MSEKLPKFDLVLQNNASKEFFTFTGLTSTSSNHLYYKFEVDIDAADGEYTYALFRNERDDVEYEFKTPLLDTILHTGDGDVLLSDLNPSTGLMRIGDKVENTNIYDDNKAHTIYYYDN